MEILKCISINYAARYCIKLNYCKSDFQVTYIVISDNLKSLKEVSTALSLIVTAIVTVI